MKIADFYPAVLEVTLSEQLTRVVLNRHTRG